MSTFAARLTAAKFALPGPIYYPRGYLKSVPASQTPARMSGYLGPPSFASDLAVAPGVWVDGSPPQAAIDKHVANEPWSGPAADPAELGGLSAG